MADKIKEMLAEYISARKHFKANSQLEGFVRELSRNCDFADSFANRTLSGRIPAEMGYTRSDYNGCRWWSSPFPVNEALRTPARAKELDFVTETMLKAFPTLRDLGDFCELFAEDLRQGNEYNLYCTGFFANYWIRAIIRERDYNLYIHSIVKPKKEA